MEKYFAKIEKDTGRIVGYLSKRKKRWLPIYSTHQLFIIRSEEDESKIIEEFEGRHGCGYYYTSTEILDYQRKIRAIRKHK